MVYLTQIILGLLIGCCGFVRIAENPVQGICALFLGGFLVMTGFEKKLLKDNQKTKIESN